MMREFLDMATMEICAEAEIPHSQVDLRAAMPTPPADGAAYDISIDKIHFGKTRAASSLQYATP